MKDSRPIDPERAVRFLHSLERFALAFQKEARKQERQLSTTVDTILQEHAKKTIDKGYGTTRRTTRPTS